MMGATNPQRGLVYNISLETFGPEDHPLRRIRPLIEDGAIRRACRDLYAPIGRPSIPPEQLFLALVGGYLLGRHQRAQAGDGAALQHGPAVVCRPESRRTALGRVDLQPESAPPLR